MSWRLSLYPCRGAVDRGPLVLLPGWAMPHQSWGPLLAALQQQHALIALDWPGSGPQALELDALLQGLAELLPERCNLLGWSLGGMLALQYARRFPARVAGVATVASNARFVAGEGWDAAMHPVQFHAFSRDVSRVPETALRRFTGFQAKGDDDERDVLRQLRDWQAAAPQPPVEQLAAGLALLGGLDSREAIADLECPQLHVFGERDNLVPEGAAPRVAALNPRARVEVVAGAAHAPFLRAPGQLADWIACQLPALPPLELPALNPYARDKRDIAESFSRAASTYDGVADLQREVGQALMALLPAEIRPARVLDLGSGTGYFSAQLASRYGAPTLSLDLAPGMLMYARRARRMPQLQWVCGDAERLPLATGSQQLVFSSLALQWCDSLERAFAEVARSLAPGGVFALATLLPGTLAELERAWARVDDDVHVNRFLPLVEVERAAASAGLKPLQQQSRRWVMKYRDTSALLHALKALGAHNVNAGRPRGLSGRSTLAELARAYEAFRERDGLPATYEVHLALYQR